MLPLNQRYFEHNAHTPRIQSHLKVKISRSDWPILERGSNIERRLSLNIISETFRKQLKIKLGGGTTKSLINLLDEGWKNHWLAIMVGHCMALELSDLLVNNYGRLFQ